jgi:hypothetical protein
MDSLKLRPIYPKGNNATDPRVPHCGCGEEKKDTPFTCFGNRTQNSRVLQPVGQSLHLLRYRVPHLKHGAEIPLAATLPHRKYHQFPRQCHRTSVIIITLKF